MVGRFGTYHSAPLNHALAACLIAGALASGAPGQQSGPPTAPAAVAEYRLEIAAAEVDFTGTPRRAMTVNGGIPGPTLRFRQGELARIRVHNAMEVATSVHWHGLLLPFAMDGVPYLTYPPIAPGTTFIYEFPIRQAGTYWYHSHTAFQEQQGVYGSIVILPAEGGAAADRDHVVMLSDWTDEDPDEVMRTLRRGSEWYAVKKGNMQSLFGAARRGELGSWFLRELQRMPPMDLADVAYDRFLANGRTTSVLEAQPGELVRLRVIDGSATTFFHLEFAGGPMTIVAADGQDVEAIEESRILIGVAETYDVLVRVPEEGAWEFRATAHDRSGYASVWLGRGKRHPAPDVPRPDLYASMGAPSLAQIFALTPAGSMGMSNRDVKAGRFDAPGMHGMEGMEGMAGMHDMEGMHGMHDMTSMSSMEGHGEEAVDGMDPRRPWAPYARLRATRATAPDPALPVREVRLTLDGDMERYVWMLNGKTLAEEDQILVRKGEVVRLVMINRTMMHHPMHLHGHFFRLLNGQGDRSPLKHTVDVEPMSTTVIEFVADESGDWFFHCHLLYHMMAGMARVVHYQDFAVDSRLAGIRPMLLHDDWFAWGQADAMSHMTAGFVQYSNNRNILTGAWEAGWGRIDGTEWEGLFTYDRYFDRFLSLFAGVDVGDAIAEERAVAGLRYRLPFDLESSAFVGSDSSARFSVGRGIPLTDRLAVLGEVQYDTETEFESQFGFDWLLSKSFSLRANWNSDYGIGAGVQVRF